MSEKRKQRLTKARLLKRLEKCAKSFDTEAAHCDADSLLLEYIDDEEIAAAYNKIEKWYA